MDWNQWSNASVQASKYGTKRYVWWKREGNSTKRKVTDTSEVGVGVGEDDQEQFKC